jgi:hypothetical protein
MAEDGALWAPPAGLAPALPALLDLLTARFGRALDLLTARFGRALDRRPPANVRS